MKIHLKPDVPPLKIEWSENKIFETTDGTRRHWRSKRLNRLSSLTGTLSDWAPVCGVRMPEHVKNSRLVLDRHQLDSCIVDNAFLLLFGDEFRWRVAAEGYTVFSNCHAVSFFYQFHIDYESAWKLFGLATLGCIRCLQCLCQGNKDFTTNFTGIYGMSPFVRF